MGFTSWGPRGPKEDSTAPMRSGCPGGSYGWEGTAASCGATIGGQGALDPWGTGISWGFHGDFMGISWGFSRPNGESSPKWRFSLNGDRMVKNPSWMSMNHPLKWLYTIIWWGWVTNDLFPLVFPQGFHRQTMPGDLTINHWGSDTALGRRGVQLPARDKGS